MYRPGSYPACIGTIVAMNDQPAAPSLPPPPLEDPPPPPLEPTPPARRRVRPWLIMLLIAVVVAGIAITLARNIEVSYYSISPGPVEAVEAYVTASGDTFAADGELYFLTVILDELTLLEYVDAALDGRVDLQERQTIRPEGVSREDLAENNRRSMEESKQRAIFVALTELGYEATLTGSGALVAGVVDASPAVGILEEGDVIVALNGTPVQLASEVVAEMGVLGPGTQVNLDVLRPQEDGPEELSVTVTLGVNPDDEERGFIGIFVDTADLNAEFPVDIDIDSRNIGGPSAGLMYSLGIVNLLTPDDITKGHTIAGTGTIEFDGRVGPIGGVRQKVFAARDIGAGYVLVPADNFEDALTAAGDDIEVVSIADMGAALAFLERLPPAPAVVAQGD